ncbi:HD domain-containing protein [Clostridium sp. Cult2]|uniref:HD domain-containing protein n=1 Tax=Clostridium sp. Cult2 TaxID=2079003 RepID=UPI001F20A2F1|nr:HD domain-containing protein [Clostridium sp. Cult2]MCF6466687.1 cytidyltransferase [Clostridium sp. Cult2]
MSKAYNEIYKLILNELERGYLKLYHKDLLQFIQRNDFKIKLNNIISKNKYDALSLMELLYPLYVKYRESPKIDWLKYIFDYVLSLSFPEKVSRKFEEELNPLVFLYLNLLRIFSCFEIRYDKSSFLHKYPIGFLESEEERNTKFLDEYLIFKNAFLDNWIYELMKMDLSLTNHNTIDHVVGVNHLSLNIGRQLKILGLPIDLGIIVGAGLGHDIGKYGVREEDIDRVPYLHYYYTEKWFNRLGIEKTGHIATNHSTWDLELENLPLESLVLIYADFRVKNKKYKNYYKMHIYTLEEAYDIILNKLDNLDSKKEQRYEKVYKKLKDFENYMLSLGVNTDLAKSIPQRKTLKPYPLMDNEEIVENIKYFAIEHNINLMAKLLDDVGFNNILEMARSEYNWRKLRLYLQIFNEYSTYLTQRQKIVTLHFLTDLLFHKEEDIRKEAAELIGLLISQYDEEYRKEVPEAIKRHNPETTSLKVLKKLLNYILYPEHKMAESHLEWQYNLKTIIKSLFYNSRIENYEKYSKLLINYYDCYQSMSPINQLYLSQTLKYIPLLYLDDRDLKRLHEYTINQLNSNILEIRLTVLDIIDEIFEELKENKKFVILLKNWMLDNLQISPYASENYLKYKLALKLDMEPHILKHLEFNYKKVEENISEIFLTNLKTATEWMNKKVNIDILYDQVKRSSDSYGLHTGMHFCNLLKVSAIEKVRNYAGHTLLHIFEFLSQEERNDIAVELLRALEMQNYQFTKYIPNYLGQLLLYLQPTELDEIIDDFEEKIRQSNTQIVFLLLKTIGICIENYPKYGKKFKEEKEFNEKRLDRLLGLLLNGMASFDEEIKAESFRIIGSQIFNSNRLLLKEKYFIFTRIGKKVLTLLTKKEDDEFIFLNNSASLNSIYRFILDYEFIYGPIELISNKKVAFFPGSFDPFSLSHKKIATEIKRQGFEVYLAVDEFSWSKRTQPHRFRRDIINMTIAHERNIFLFPSEIPVNISNYKDLIKLKSLFNNRTEIINNINDNLIQYLNNKFGHRIDVNVIYELRNKLNPVVLLIKETKSNSILGFSIFYWVRNIMLYDEFQNTNITEYFRQHSKGRLVLISGIYTENNDYHTAEIILNETLAYCISLDYNYAIFKNCLTHHNKKYIEENLKHQGFIETPFTHNGCPIFMVDMNNPMTLNQDLENLLKPPFENNLELKKIIYIGRKKLKEAISSLYPGELLLSFNRDMIYSKLIQKICDANEVSITQKRNRVLGPNICVPFGSILNGTILPNTITKTMHTEKIFNPSIDNFTIEAFPNYLSLENQSKVLESFDRPVILVDDLLHKGYRLNVIEPLLRKTQVHIKKVIVGILTGRGSEIGKVKNIDVDSAYFVPNLKLWFNESDQYPFIGGDMVLRDGATQDYLISSINLILPYISPSFIKNTSTKNIYRLSETCLINTIEIFKVIEKVYQEINEKNLIIKNLGEILVSPRRPDTYKSMDSLINLKPSSCLEADLEHLKRIENIVNR